MTLCKRVAKTLAEHQYEDLPRWKKRMMFFHINFCVICGKHHRQVVEMQKGISKFIEHENQGDIHPKVHLSDEAKKRIHHALDSES